MTFFDYIAISISIAGSTIIIWGVVINAFRFLKLEYKKLLNQDVAGTDDKIRHALGSYLRLGLDFMVAADIIRTIQNPVLQELYVLAFIVAIRSVISFFLQKEMENEKKYLTEENSKTISDPSSH